MSVPGAQGTETVDLWIVPLSGAPNTGLEPRGLSGDELRRADRFISEFDRRRYAVAHGAVRLILGWYLACEPERIAIDYATTGKPALAHYADRLAFSIAHTEDLLACAVTRGCRVGVDLERVDYAAGYRRIAERYFSAREKRALAAARGRAWTHAFLAIWTRKEACLKASGRGLRFGLGGLDVWRDEDRPRGQFFELNGADAPPWLLCDIRPREDHVGAVAVGAVAAVLRRMEFVLACRA